MKTYVGLLCALLAAAGPAVAHETMGGGPVTIGGGLTPIGAGAIFQSISEPISYPQTMDSDLRAHPKRSPVAVQNEALCKPLFTAAYGGWIGCGAQPPLEFLTPVVSTSPW